MRGAVRHGHMPADWRRPGDADILRRVQVDDSRGGRAHEALRTCGGYSGYFDDERVR